MTVFQMTMKRWKLDWDWEGEGRSGNFNKNDTEDQPLLRVYLYRLDNDFEYRYIISYCTLAHKNTPEEVLLDMSNDLIKDIEDMPVYLVREPVETWTWRTKYGWE